MTILNSESPPGVNGSIKGRGIAHRKLSHGQLAILAAKARLGELSVGDLSTAQTCQLFGVTSADVDKATKHLNANRLLDAAAYLVSVWQGTPPEARAAAVKSIGPDDVLTVLVSAAE